MMKTHWRMYKDGKKWVFAAATMTALTLGLGTLNVHAQDQQGQISTVTVKDNRAGDSQGELSPADQGAGTVNEQPVEQTEATAQTAAAVTNDQSPAAPEQSTKQNQTPDQQPAQTQPSAGQQAASDESASLQVPTGQSQQPASQAAQQAPTQPEQVTAQQPQANDVEETTATKSDQVSQSNDQPTDPVPVKSQSEDKSVINKSAVDKSAVDKSVDQTPVVKTAAALKNTNALTVAVDINSWMPDKNMQSQILELLISQKKSWRTMPRLMTSPRKMWLKLLDYS